MLVVGKYRYYRDRSGRLARIISDRLVDTDLFVAVVNPNVPEYSNLVFVNMYGMAERGNDQYDLISDVTCGLCNGKGTFLSYGGPDTAILRPCHVCSTKGHH